jgi:hypothetical protein
MDAGFMLMNEEGRGSEGMRRRFSLVNALNSAQVDIAMEGAQRRASASQI